METPKPGSLLNLLLLSFIARLCPIRCRRGSARDLRLVARAGREGGGWLESDVWLATVAGLHRSQRGGCVRKRRLATVLRCTASTCRGCMQHRCCGVRSVELGARRRERLI